MFLLEASLLDSLRFNAMLTICADSMSRVPLLCVLVLGDVVDDLATASPWGDGGLAAVVPVSLVSVLGRAGAVSTGAPCPLLGVSFARVLSGVPEVSLGRW